MIQHISYQDTLEWPNLNSCQCGNDGRGSEPVSDQREVCQVALDGWIQDLGRPGVAQRGSILVQQIHQLLDDHPAKESFYVVTYN